MSQMKTKKRTKSAATSRRERSPEGAVGGGTGETPNSDPSKMKLIVSYP